MNPLAIGIIGFGRIGYEHATWLGRCAAARAVAVADATPARRGLAAAAGLRVYETVEALLGDPSIDAVLVATPTSMHCDPAMAALNADKHVMIEKPMSLNFSQAKRITEEAA